MRAFILILALSIASLSWLNPAEARPGGGHSSSGHHSSSSHSSSSHGSFSHGSYSSHGTSSHSSRPMSNEELVIFLIIVIVFILIKMMEKMRNEASSLASMPTPIIRARRQDQVKQQMALLKQSDQNFSGILFLDFVHSLYSKFYSYSTHPEFRYLSPFLSADLQRHFDQAGPWTITEVVINGIKWQEINTEDQDSETICLVIDANYTLDLQGKRTRYAVTERWQFKRKKGLLSPEPEKMQSLCCPHCGAPAQFTDAGLCEHCARVIRQGDRQWYLTRRAVLETTALAAADLVSYAEEQGTHLATITQDDLSEQMKRFLQLHGLADWEDFWRPFVDNVVKAYFISIYSAWSHRDWQAARHLLSDRLFEANLFWQQLYAEQNWVNRLDQLNVGEIEVAKIEIDMFYEAVTVRIFASCYDYTEDANGKVIGGSKRALRLYSEYWTFVRRIGAEKSSAPYSINQCPQCGAPADNIGQTAVCGYCGSKISTGEFSWVLFLITQDEAYDG